MHYVVQAGLKLLMLCRLRLEECAIKPYTPFTAFEFSNTCFLAVLELTEIYPCLLNAEIKDVHYSAWLPSFPPNQLLFLILSSS